MPNKHIPALSPDSLTVALQQLERVNMPAAAKKAIADMLKAAANPESEHPAEVMKTLPGERKINVQTTALTVQKTAKDIAGRGRAGLLAMSAEEWQRLIDGE
jgi:hypothetical protein